MTLATTSVGIAAVYRLPIAQLPDYPITQLPDAIISPPLLFNAAPRGREEVLRDCAITRFPDQPITRFRECPHAGGDGCRPDATDLRPDRARDRRAKSRHRGAL